MTGAPSVEAVASEVKIEGEIKEEEQQMVLPDKKEKRKRSQEGAAEGDAEEPGTKIVKKN